MSLPESAKSNNATRSDRLRAALDYAARGWPVFPCRTGGKEPLTPRGHLDATTDPSRITAWWNRWPEANIGVPTGERSGIFALDVDQPAGLEELERKHGKLPATRTHGTGSGGMHYLYRYPAGANIRNSAGKLAEGLDVRAEGGYVIVPPSSTTRPYELLDDLPLAETPERVIEALTQAQSPASGRAGRGTRTTTAVADLDGPIPAGARDDKLASIAGRLHDGRDLEELTAGLLEVNAARCRPPLPDTQVEKIARSIHRRQPCKQSARAEPETLEALDGIEARLWRIGWRGMGELSARDVYVALIKAGRSHGELIPAGVRISISVRALALSAAVSKRTAHYAIKRLKAAGLIRSDNAERSGTRSGALVLLIGGATRANLHHSTTRRRRDSSGATLRAPRLRWSAPIIERVGDEVFRSTLRRLGKSCGAVIDALERAGGSATVEELADALHKSRTRDLRRRTVARLEAAQVVECSGDTVALARDWLDALNIERENAGEIDAHRRDMARFAREREAYANRDSIKPGPVPERPPDISAGSIEELHHVEDVAPELVEALAAYLDRNPRRRDEAPSWLSVAMWADGYLPEKPAPAAVEVALIETGTEAA